MIDVGHKMYDGELGESGIGFVISINRTEKTFRVSYPLSNITREYPFGTLKLTNLDNDDIISVNGVGAPKKIPDIVADIVSMLTREGEVDLAVHVLNYYKEVK